MDSPPKTLDELRTLVRRGQGRTRPLFTVKLYEVVNFVADHPESIEEAGAAWCPDGSGVLVQHQALAKMFGVKAETIPRNLNDHGFRKVKMSPNEEEEFGKLLDNPDSWRKEVQKDGLFNVQTPVEQVMGIPKSPPSSPTFHGRLLDFIPYELTGVISESQCIDLLGLKNDLRYDDDRANNAIRKAWCIWSRGENGRGARMQELPLREVLISLIPASSSPRAENENQALRIHVAHLIWRSDRPIGAGRPAAEERIPFAVFMQFIVRYWSFEDQQYAVIRDLAEHGTSVASPRWKEWFLPPPANLFAARGMMSNPNEKRIFVVESTHANSFHVLIWNDSRDAVLVGRVRHHPDRPEAFEVVFPGGQVTAKMTLSELLEKSLEFCMPWAWQLRLDPMTVVPRPPPDHMEGPMPVDAPVVLDGAFDEDFLEWGF
jgi:hypothetical protein